MAYAMNELAANPMQAAAFLRSESQPAKFPTQVSISFGERTDRAALRQAWEAVCSAHPILRSSFSRGPGGEVITTRTDAGGTTWKELDWTSVDAAEIPERWNQFQADDARETFDAAGLVRFSEILLPGGGSHFLLSTPEYLLDETSITRALLDWLIALEQPLSPEEPPALPSASAAAWAPILKSASMPLVLHPRSGASDVVSAKLPIGREESARFFAAVQDRDPGAIIGFLWALTLRRLGAEGNVALHRTDARRSTHDVGYFENWLPVVLDWGAKRWPDGLDADTLRANAWISPAAALAAAEPSFSLSDLRTGFAWGNPDVNDIIHTALPRWINFDARIHRNPPDLLWLEARPDLALHVRGPLGSEAAAQHLLLRLAALIESVEPLTSKPASQIPLLLPQETRTLKEWSRGPEPLERPPTTLAAFQEIVARTPDAIAVKDGDYELTYRELDALSDRLAQHLAHATLAGGWHVALFLSPSSWIAIALIGSWKAGNLCLALDPSAPPDWIESMLASHDAGVVFCDAASAPLLDTSTRRRIILDQDWESLETADCPPLSLTGSSPAAILAGHPDGPAPIIRALTHEMLTSAAREGARTLDFQPGHSFLAHSAAGGGAFFDEWLIPLLNGGTAIVPGDDLLDPIRSSATHLRLTSPEWANQAARWAHEPEVLDSPLQVVAVELGKATGRANEIWTSCTGGRVRTIPFFSPASLCGLGVANTKPVSPGLFLPAGFPVGGIEASVTDADAHEIPPGFLGRFWIKCPDWKSLANPHGRRGIETGLQAWRSPDGSLSIEGTCAPGLTCSDRAADLLSTGAALDTFEAACLWTLSREKFPGTIPVEEWPLTRGGWVDADLLPKPQSAPKPTPSAARVVATAPPRPSETPWQPVSVLQQEGSGRPLVLVPPLSGLPESYHDLVVALGTKRKILGLQARGTSQPDAAHTSLEAAAAAWIDALLEEDPTLSFDLCGFGYGAIAALEIARQLEAAKRPVPALILLGAPAPQTDAPTGWLASMKSVLKRLNPGDRVEPYHTAGEPARTHESAWSRYRFIPFDVHARVILPSDFPPDAGAAWIDVLPSADIDLVKCTWAEMLSFPGVKRLASLIEG